jgi:hypothetical protein
MTENKIKNLISFCFLFNRNMGSHWVDQSPDYILEKWNSIIGFEPEEYPYLSVVENINQINRWVNKWSVSEDFLKKNLRIIVFLRIMDTKSLSHRDEGFWLLSNIIYQFESNFGDGSVSKIRNNIGYIHTHTIIRGIIEDWYKIPENSREMTLIKLLD